LGDVLSPAAPLESAPLELGDLVLAVVAPLVLAVQALAMVVPLALVRYVCRVSPSPVPFLQKWPLTFLLLASYPFLVV
jgi:hypothetical protein